jgi:predicted glycosyltransferase involved in capsule biosynthesis
MNGLGAATKQLTLSLVIPLRVHSRHSRDIRRLRRLLKTIPAEIEVVVADDSPSFQTRNLVAQLTKCRDKSMHVECFGKDGEPFSVGRLRDAGVAASRGQYILLHDVDFSAPESTYTLIASKDFRSRVFGNSDRAFCCIPVFFTSPAGWLFRYPTRLLLRFRFMQTYTRTTAGAWLGRLVLGSSALLIRRSHYLDAGGHSKAFKGHGAEDFEFLHRLSNAFPKGKRSSDYTIDCGPKGFETKGFREYFSRYGQLAMSMNIFFIHRWHPRRREDPSYINARKGNFETLYAVLSTK